MFSKVMNLEVAGHPHNPGDVIRMDGERWFVASVDYNGSWSKVYVEPLSSYIAKTTLISRVPEDCTIAEYLNRICDEYEENCCC